MDVILFNVNIGIVINNGNGSFIVSVILVGIDLMYIVIGVDLNCMFGFEIVVMLDCFCFVIVDLVVIIMFMICFGEFILIFSVMVDAG